MPALSSRAYRFKRVRWHTFLRLTNDKPCFIAASLKGFVRRANDEDTYDDSGKVNRVSRRIR